MKMRVMAWIMCLSILLQAVPVAAAENDTLNTWQLSNVKLEHTTVEFQLRGVESAQDASVVIENTELYTSENNTFVCEIPFSISSSTERISLSVPDGKSTYVDCLSKDKETGGLYILEYKGSEDPYTVYKSVKVIK